MSETAYVLPVIKQEAPKVEEKAEEKEEVVQTDSASEVENRAREMGWRPQEEYKGAREWVDAATFIKRGEESLPLMKKQYEALQRDLETVKKDAVEYRKLVEQAAEAKWKKQYDDLVAKQAQAITEGNGEEFAAAQQQLAEHASKKPAPKQEAPQLPPEVQAWAEKNPWINTHYAASVWAQEQGQKAKAQGKSTEEVLQIMREAAEEKFPELFDLPQQRTTAQRGGRTGVKTNSRTFDNLPQDAKEACDRMIRRGWFKTREEYLANYQWD